MEEKDVQRSRHIGKIIFRVREGHEIKPEDRVLLDEWIGQDDRNKELYDRLMSAEYITGAIADLKKFDVEGSRARLVEILQLKEARVIPMSRRFVAAAAILILIAGGLYLWQRVDNSENNQQQAATTFKSNVFPGTKVPQLVLSDGSRLNLDSSVSGDLSVEGSVTVRKLANGEIVYAAASSAGPVRYNAIHNPTGSMVVSLKLTDGSKVWLNAGSSITYPTAFTGNDRKVSITGEAYFEVATDHTKPFIVTKGNTAVEVLGTRFNVNSFDDEPTLDITLLEGAVRVTHLNQRLILKPGQQARVDISGMISLGGNIDIEKVMAWKNGLFHFDGTDIRTIMRQVARWYDVEVVYESIPNYSFVAEQVPRNVPVSELLKVLEATDLVHFRVDKNRITVTR